MKVLVTGGAGFIGSHVVDALVARGHQVIVFDNIDPQAHPSGIPKHVLSSGAGVCIASVTERDSLEMALKGTDAVIHFAAAVGLTQSQYQVKHYLDTNIGGTANLLDIISHGYRPKKVVVAASMSSYGPGRYFCPRCRKDIYPPPRTDATMSRGNWDQMCPVCDERLMPDATTEDAPLNSQNMYAMSKKVQEEMVLNICKTYDVPAVSLRLYSTYGPRQCQGNPYTGVVAIFMGALRAGRPPVIYEDGGQMRDFIYVSDVVMATIMALESNKGDGQAFNVGSGKPVTIATLAKWIGEELGSDIAPLVPGRYRSGDIRHGFGDVTKLRQTYGWEPRVSLHEGIGRLRKWSEANNPESPPPAVDDEMKKYGLLKG
jgi:dTDP-L-rhamnose 4-epimerase